MDNRDANSANITNDRLTQPLQIIKVYPLDGRPVAKSMLWVAVTQLPNETSKKLFLRDGQRHRLISTSSALCLLSNENKKDLSAILKITNNKDGSVPTISPNNIERIRNHPLLNQVNSSGNQNIANAPSFDLINTDIHSHTLILGQENTTLSATSTSLIAISELVQKAQLGNWGAIKVTGSDFFRRQVWLEAAARGLFVEGYMYTEDDRQTLLNRIPRHAHNLIRPEYRAIKKNVFTKATVETEANAKIIKKSKSANDSNRRKLDVLDLSELELTYLLMRVHQMDINKKNLADSDIKFVSNDSTGISKIEADENTRDEACAYVELLPIQYLNANEDDTATFSADQLSDEPDL